MIQCDYNAILKFIIEKKKQKRKIEFYYSYVEEEIVVS